MILLLKGFDFIAANRQNATKIETGKSAAPPRENRGTKTAKLPRHF